MKIKFYNPKILINKRRTPILYIDTYLWYDILKKHQNELDLLRNCCESKLIIIALTNAIIGELKQRNIFDEIKSICGDSLVSVPLGRISANQVIHSMLCFFHNKKTINFDWNLATSEVPVLEKENTGLKALVDNLRNEMNNANAKYYGRKETLISIFVGLERDVWKDALRVYGEILNNGLFANTKKENLYDDYFLTDYFALLPFVVIKSSLFAYLLNERPINSQDIVDIHSLAEIMPYSTLFIMDKDQHNRFKQIQKDCPMIFDRIDDLCFLSSYLKNNKYNPLEALQSFLEYASSKE